MSRPSLSRKGSTMQARRLALLLVAVPAWIATVGPSGTAPASEVKPPEIVGRAAIS